MGKKSVLLLVCLAACTAEAVPAAHGVDAGAGLVVVPGALRCRPPTKGLLMGDSIVSRMFYAARPELEADGDTVLSMAVGGESTLQQLNNWVNGTVPYPVPATPYRGDPSFGWIFLEVGVNEMRAGFAADVSCGWHVQLLDDIHEHNPGAAVILGVVLPARGYFDSINVAWQNVVDLNTCLTQLGATSIIFVALDDGAGALAAPFDSGDKLHPSDAGSVESARLIRGLVAERLGPVCR